MPNAPTDYKERKDTPIFTVMFGFFPLAMQAVARVAKKGSEKHNPGQPVTWTREKSGDHADCIARHMLDLGAFDEDGELHDAHVAWRALANLQIAEEKRLAAGATPTNVEHVDFTAGGPAPKPKFKKGDFVRAKNSEHGVYRGHTYEVQHRFTSGYILVAGNMRLQDEYNFALATPETSVGEKVLKGLNEALEYAQKDNAPHIDGAAGVWMAGKFYKAATVHAALTAAGND